MDPDIIQTDADFDDVFAFFIEPYVSETDNTPRDISAYTAAVAMQRQGSSDAPIALTAYSTVENTNQVVIHVPQDVVVTWPLGSYLLDIVLLDGSGRRMGGVFQTYQMSKGYTL